MSVLGKSLVFYIKHYPMMAYLYEDYDEEGSQLPQIDGFSESEIRSIIEQLNTIADNAVAEYKELKNQTQKLFESKLSSHFSLERVIKKDGWSGLENRVWVKKKVSPDHFSNNRNGSRRLE